MLRRARPRRSSPRTLRSRGAGRSLRVLLTALVVLLAQGPTLLHLLLVPHATCEHGELIETVAVTSSTSPASGAGSTSRAEYRSNRPQIEQGRAERGGHEHCDALAVRSRLPEVGVPVAPATLLTVLAIEAGGARDEARPVPLLALAPKSSPPSA